MTLERKTPAASNEAHGEAHESRAETANPAVPGVAAPPTDDLTDPRATVQIDGRRRQLAGVRIARAEEAALSRSIRLPGVVKFDESRWTEVALRLEGYVRDLYVDRTGQAVRQGQPLFSIYSPDVATAIAEYRLAVQARGSLDASGSAGAREQSARLVEAARLRLTRWNVSADQIEAPETAGEPRTTFRSPVSGIVMEKAIVKGMRAMPGDVLYRIVDPSVIWVEASVYEPDLGAVAVGQRGVIRINAFPDDVFDGRITYVAPGLDPESRTAIVRFELPNRRGRLKAGMFASVELSVPLGRGLVVPADAVLDSGARQLVFVSKGDGYFEPRSVVVGHRVEGRVEITSGLSVGDQVAEGAAFFIDSESQLRAAAQGYADAGTSQSATAAPTEELSIDARGLAGTLESRPGNARGDCQERRRAADWRRSRDGRVRDGGDAFDEHARDASLGDAHPNRRRLSRMHRRSDVRPVGRDGLGDPRRRSSRIAAAHHHRPLGASHGRATHRLVRAQSQRSFFLPRSASRAGLPGRCSIPRSTRSPTSPTCR